MSATHVSGKILAVYPPISAFVLCGFEHCVANMFYIPAGMMTASAYGIAAEGLNIGTFIFNNLIPATIGNIFGGVIVVGCLYWYLFLREKTKLHFLKRCALAHSRAEARLPRQPSTPAPSAHPRGAFLSYGNEVFYTIKNPTSTTEAA